MEKVKPTWWDKSLPMYASDGYRALAFELGKSFETAEKRIRQLEAQLAEMKTRALTMEEQWANGNAEIKTLEAQLAEANTLARHWQNRFDKMEANYDTAIKQLTLANECSRNAEADAAKLKGALEMVEWVWDGIKSADHDNATDCPWCLNIRYKGHKPDCDRQAALSPRQPESADGEVSE